MPNKPPPDPTARVFPPINPSEVRDHLKSIYNQWNAAYRGLVPHGIRLPAPDSTDEYDDPETFGDVVQIVTPADIEPIIEYKSIVPVPVVIIDDLQPINRHTDTYFTAYQELVDSTKPKLIVNNHNSRISVRLSNNGPGTVYLGQNESISTSGYAFVLNEALTLTTTRDIWAIQVTGQGNPAAISIIYEYEKEISHARP